jgi:hypothetical protein
MQVIGIEQRLGDEAFFEEAVGDRDQDDGGKSAARAPRPFTDEDRGRSVHRCHQRQQEDHRGGQRAQQVLADQRAGEEQAQRGPRGAFHGVTLSIGNS